MVFKYQKKSLRLWEGVKVIFKCLKERFLKGFLHLSLRLEVNCFERSIKTGHVLCFECSSCLNGELTNRVCVCVCAHANVKQLL